MVAFPPRHPVLAVVLGALCAGVALGAEPEPNWVTEMPSLHATTGLLRVFAADAGQKGSLRFQISAEAFHAREFLAYSPADADTRFGLRVALGYSPLEHLELFAMVQGSTNENSLADPRRMSVFGDILVGAKGCVPVTTTSCLGAEGAALFLAAGADGSTTIRSTSFLLRLLGTLDIPSLPARLHLNFGGTLDNSDALLRPGDDPIRRFAYRLHEAHRLFVGVGLELRMSRLVTPFAEWSLEMPIGLPTDPENPGAPGFSAFPQILSVGARMFPWKGLSLLTAVDLAITWNGRVGVPAVPPWQVVFGIGYSLGSKPRLPAPRKDDDLSF